MALLRRISPRSLAVPLLLAIPLFVVACHDNPQSPGGSLQAEATRQRAAWVRQGITDYTFVFERFCFCPGLAATVVVENNQVLSAKDLDTGLPLSPQLMTEIRTVSQMFDFIDEVIVADPDNMTVTYDNALSFPTLISVDWIITATDDEIALQAGFLVPAATP